MHDSFFEKSSLQWGIYNESEGEQSINVKIEEKKDGRKSSFKQMY